MRRLEEAREDCDRRWREAEEGAAAALARSWTESEEARADMAVAAAADLPAAERRRTEGKTLVGVSEVGECVGARGRPRPSPLKASSNSNGALAAVTQKRITKCHKRKKTIDRHQKGC